MLDINLIRNEGAKVKALLAKKGWDFNPNIILSLDEKRRKLRVEVEETKA